MCQSCYDKFHHNLTHAVENKEGKKHFFSKQKNLNLAESSHNSSVFQPVVECRSSGVRGASDCMAEDNNTCQLHAHLQPLKDGKSGN